MAQLAPETPPEFRKMLMAYSSRFISHGSSKLFQGRLPVEVVNFADPNGKTPLAIFSSKGICLARRASIAPGAQKVDFVATKLTSLRRSPGFRPIY